jgi:DNA-binding NarL/FixJ family response regulator
MSLKVLLIDDHMLFREGLIRLLLSSRKQSQCWIG